MPLASMGVRHHHRGQPGGSPQARPHLRGRRCRRAGVSHRMSPVIDAGVQPHFRYNAEIRRYLAPTHKLRSIPDVEQQWYQAPGGDYRQDLYGNGYPGSDPDTVARHLFSEGGVDYAILNPLTRGNIADYLLNSRICEAVNDWLLDRWLEPDATGRFRGTIRVNPEDVRGAVQEIERLADHPKMVQVGVPLQSREPYGKPMFEPIGAGAAPRGGREPQRESRGGSRSGRPRPPTTSRWPCTSTAATASTTHRRSQ